MDTIYGAVLLLLQAYLLLQGVYRLYLHPLRHFPGPRLAASTYLHEFYFNCIRGGKFIFEIDRMHRAYGTPKNGTMKRRRLTSSQAQSSALTPTRSMFAIQNSIEKSTRRARTAAINTQASLPVLGFRHPWWLPSHTTSTGDDGG